MFYLLINGLALLIALWPFSFYLTALIIHYIFDIIHKTQTRKDEASHLNKNMQCVIWSNGKLKH